MIKLDSQGSVFFTQERLGRRNTTFRIVKFRTMFTDADERLAIYLAENPEAHLQWDKYKKLKDYDPRVTKVGRLLRKLSLDELPQTFNILKGEMSFVGPRPFLMREKKYLAGCCDDICLVRPGITTIRSNQSCTTCPHCPCHTFIDSVNINQPRHISRYIFFSLH